MKLTKLQADELAFYFTTRWETDAEDVEIAGELAEEVRVTGGISVTEENREYIRDSIEDIIERIEGMHDDSCDFGKEGEWRGLLSSFGSLLKKLG